MPPPNEDLCRDPVIEYSDCYYAYLADDKAQLTHTRVLGEFKSTGLAINLLACRLLEKLCKAIFAHLLSSSKGRTYKVALPPWSESLEPLRMFKIFWLAKMIYQNHRLSGAAGSSLKPRLLMLGGADTRTSEQIMT